MSMKLLGYRETTPGVYKPVHIEGRFIDGLPFKDPPEAQGRRLYNPWDGTVRDGKTNSYKLAIKTMYVELALEHGGGFRIEYDFGG